MDVLRIPPVYGQAVAGESHYQNALHDAAHGRTADVSGGNFDRAIWVQAQLIPERDNRYDRNAVAVVVSEQLVGYLPAEVAGEWHEVLLKLWSRGNCVCCAAGISGGGDRNYGIFLRICDLAVVEFLGQTPSWAVAMSGSADVTVTGEDRHQSELRELTKQLQTATLHRSTVSRGKYAGQPTVEIRINGKRVGELTRLMGARYLPTVDRLTKSGRTPMCQARLEDDHRGRQVSLLLPSKRELAEQRAVDMPQ